MASLTPGVVALHRPTFACHYAGADRMAGRAISGGKANTGGQSHDRAAESGAATFAVGHTGHAAGGVFGFFGHCPQLLGRRLEGVFQIEIRERAFGQHLFRGEARIGVLGCRLRHRDSALRQFAQRLIAQVACMDRGRAFAHEHPQARAFAFRAFDILQRAQAHLHPFGHITNCDSVGGISPETTRERNQRVAPFFGAGEIEHERPFTNNRRKASPDQKMASSAFITRVRRKGRPMAKPQTSLLSRR